jgi:hypothetical protein
VELFHDLGDRFHEAEALAHFADTQHATGHPDTARDAWNQALAILTDLHHPTAQQIRARLGTVPTTA